MGQDSKKIGKRDKPSFTKDRCRICGSNNLIPYIDFGNLK